MVMQTRATKRDVLELKSELYKAMMVQTFVFAGTVIAIMKFMN